MDNFVVNVPGHIGVESRAACCSFAGLYMREEQVTFVAVVLGFLLAVANR